MVQMMSSPSASRRSTSLLNPPVSVQTHGTECDVTERALIERCKSGDAAAWDELVQRYEKPIYKFAYSLCRSHEDSDDISGQVLLRLYLNIKSFRYESGFTSWLFRIVRNAYVDMCLRPAHRKNISLDSSSGADGDAAHSRDIVDPTAGPERKCIDKEVASLLARAVGHLPAYQRDVVRMFHTEGKSYETIAATTGLSIGTVKSRLNRARTMLRERLTPIRETLMVA